jgi:hypothetical protein
VVERREDAEALAGRELVGPEVDAPVLIPALGHGRQDAKAGGELPTALGADFQAFFPGEPPHALVVHHPDLAAQEHP